MVPPRRGPAIVACGLLVSGLAAAADPPDPPREPAIVVSADPSLSLETGADLTLSTVSLLARGEGLAFRPLHGRRWARRVARGTWGLLFDVPVAWWFSVYLHEAHGHGGRARELGSSAGYHLVSPWSGRRSYATFDPTPLSDDDRLRVFAGGSEANGHAATLLERDVVAGRAMRPLELLYLAGSRFVTSRYVLHTTPDPGSEPERFWAEWRGGGDVANYLGYLSLRATGDPGITPSGVAPQILDQHARLERHARWNALDPGAWLALFTVTRLVWRGEEVGTLPLPVIRGRRVLPIASAEWQPGGGTRSLELVVGPPAGAAETAAPRWSSLVLRRGRGPEGGLAAVGVATESFFRGARWRWGGELELWHEPRRRLGGGVRVRGTRRIGPQSEAFLELGAKSAGHWPGRPAPPGPMVRLGLRLSPGRPGPAGDAPGDGRDRLQFPEK